MATSRACKLAAISWQFVTLKLKKSPVNGLKIRACSKSRRFCGDKSPRNLHEIPASLHGRFGIAAKIAGVNGPLKSDSLYDKMTSNMVRMHGGG